MAKKSSRDQEIMVKNHRLENHYQIKRRNSVTVTVKPFYGINGLVSR